MKMLVCRVQNESLEETRAWFRERNILIMKEMLEIPLYDYSPPSTLITQIVITVLDEETETLLKLQFPNNTFKDASA